MAWRLKGHGMIAPLNEDLLFLEFDSSEEARWVLENGRRWFKGDPLHLKWWNLEACCVKQKDWVKEVWLRAVGLPLYLQTPKILRMIGDNCGGFIAIDKEIALRMKLLWARILVRWEGKEKSSTINILTGSRSFELQVWWEILPWTTGVFPVRRKAKNEVAEIKRRDERFPRAPQRVKQGHGKRNDKRKAKPSDVAWKEAKTCLSMAGNLTLQSKGRDIPNVDTQVHNGVHIEVGSESGFGTQWVGKGKARETLGLWISKKKPKP